MLSTQAKRAGPHACGSRKRLTATEAATSGASPRRTLRPGRCLRSSWGSAAAPTTAVMIQKLTTVLRTGSDGHR